MSNLLFPILLFSSTYIVNSQYMKTDFQRVFENNHSNFSETGLVVSISNNDSLIWENAAGYSNRSFQIKASPSHKFRIGSITKQFTSIAILKLAEEGTLDLQDSLKDYFPDLKGNYQITIEHLLTHTSGITDYTTKTEWLPKYSKLFTSPNQVYDYIRQDELRFIPGSKYEYNNSGYHLLGLIIEQVSKRSYAEYLNENIFAPLNMANTLVLDSKEVISDMAMGYDIFSDFISYPEYVHPAQPFSSGSLVSTTGDLQKWYTGLFSGKIITKEMLEKACKPFVLNDGTQTNYGYGWQVKNMDDQLVIHHNGSYPGYISEVQYFPETGILITALSNAMPLSRLMKELTALSQGKEVKELNYLELSKAELARFTHKYSNDSEVWNFVLQEGDLHYSVNEGPLTKILPVSPTKFYSPDWDIFIEFIMESNDQCSAFKLYWNGEEYLYKLAE